MIINPKVEPMKELEKELKLPPVQKASFIPKAKAEYVGNTNYETNRKKLITNIRWDYETSEQLVYECYRQTKTPERCIKSYV
jgi:hypothetical protein